MNNFRIKIRVWKFYEINEEIKFYEINEATKSNAVTSREIGINLNNTTVTIRTKPIR